MASSSFAAFIARGRDSARVNSFTPSQTGGQTFVPGSLWYFDTSANKIRLCGADPSLIGGISEVDSEANRVITASGRVPAYMLGPDEWVMMSCATTLSEANVDRNYGIDLVGNYWLIDLTDTSTTRVLVRRVLTDINAALVSFMNATLQYGVA